MLKYISILLITFSISFAEINLTKLSGLFPIYDKTFEIYIMSDKMIGILNYLNYAMLEKIVIYFLKQVMNQLNTIILLVIHGILML